GCNGIANGSEADAPSLAAGEGVLAILKALWAFSASPRRASRAAFLCAASDSLKLPRFCDETDQIPPVSPGIPFSFLGRLPNDVDEGHGRSSSDEATASDSGVPPLRTGCATIQQALHDIDSG
ncbi:hypothetical protein B0A55_13610, partial [Friedmanniomyces simplex]